MEIYVKYVRWKIWESTQLDDQEVDGRLAAKRNVTPPGESELSLGPTVSIQTVIRSILEITNHLQTSISKMPKKPLDREVRPETDIT
jgi:hypothetical protein